MFKLWHDNLGASEQQILRDAADHIVEYALRYIQLHSTAFNSPHRAQPQHVDLGVGVGQDGVLQRGPRAAKVGRRGFHQAPAV
jgi:hypothetical protein